MDCYIKGMHYLLYKNGKSIDADMFSFLTGYTVSRAWLDKTAAKTFDVPVIYPAWYPNTDFLLDIFSQLDVKKFSTFIDYLKYIRKQVATTPVLVPLDRYYLEYIQPRHHMGAHYIIIQQCSKDMVSFLDPFDDNWHTLSIEQLEEATHPPERKVQYEGYLTICVNTAKRMKIRSVSLLDCFQQRIERCRETLVQIRYFSSNSIPDVSRLAVKLSMQGILESDFYRANGYRENLIFYRKQKMMFSIVSTRLLVNYFRAIAFASLWLYRRHFRISMLHWQILLFLYMLGMRVELLHYLCIRHCIRTGWMTNKRFFWS